MPPARILVFCALAVAASLQAQVITNFGASVSSAGSSGWSYNPATSRLTGLESPGDTVCSSIPVSLDLSGSSAIRLTADAATAPAGLFTVTLESTGSQLVVAQFSWLSFVGGASITSLWSDNPSFDPANVIGWTIDAGPSGSAIDVTFSQMTAVPEPAAAAFLVSAIVLLAITNRVRNRLTARA